MQGFGNVGSVAARLLAADGCTITGIGDRSGPIYNARGVDVEAAARWVSAHGLLEGFPGGESISNDELLTLPVDALVPAALGMSSPRRTLIACGHGSSAKARTDQRVPRPTSAAADELLEQQGVFVIPDILANAGGVTVSYFEWVQNRAGYRWPEAQVNESLGTIMEHAFDEVMQTAAAHDTTPRTAAYVLAVGRVAEAHRLRGVYA